MKAILILFLGIAIVSLIIYVVPPYHQKAIGLLSYNQCDTPLSYKIGSIDPRFDLTNDNAKNDIDQATKIWDDAESKMLFVNSADANLTVNFVYDQRQALDNQINQLKSNLNQNSQQLKQQIQDYNIRLASFEAQVTQFRETVSKYNSQGGAPPGVYEDLLKQQAQLKDEADSLNAQAKQLNLSTSQYDSSVSVLNQDIRQFNSVIAQKPEEGLFNGNDNTITIYFANNQQELIHTLSHEFGHALGMEHVSDPQGVMYPYTTNSLTLTTSDERQLNYVCRQQSAIVHWSYVFDNWLIAKLQNLKPYLSKLIHN